MFHLFQRKQQGINRDPPRCRECKDLMKRYTKKAYPNCPKFKVKLLVLKNNQ